MKRYRSYKEMTADEKRHAVYLWNQFYNAQLHDDFVSSWKYWLERLEYLQEIGVDLEEANHKKELEKVA